MKPLSRAEKRLALISAFCLLVLGGTGFQYQRETASSSITIPPPLPTPSPNGFDVYVAATRAITPANPPVDAIYDTKRAQRTPQQAAILYSSRRRNAWIASNAQTWSLMARAKTLPCRCPNLRTTTGVTPAWSELRDLARCQSIRVAQAKANNEWGDAANWGLDTFEMARNIERGSVFIGSLVAMAIESVANRPLEDVPSHLNTQEAKAATRRLESIINGAQPFAEVLREEKWTVLTAIEKEIHPSGVSSIISTFIAPRAHVMSTTSQMMDGFIAQSDKPTLTRTPVPKPLFTPTTAVANNLFDVFLRASDNDARRNVQERLLLLRLALRAYVLEHGTYPTKLTALAPAYVQKVPVDPYGKGESFRYQTSGSSYTLWSIGPDGLDNHATPIPRLKNRAYATIDLDSKGDVVVHP